MPDNLMLAGKTVLITGASSGFGEHFARVAVKAGANVAVCARRLPRLETLAVELNRPGGPQVVAAAMDVNNIDSIRAAFDSVEAKLGTVDVVVNNSGIANPKLSLEMDEADWDDVMNTNLKGAFFVAQEASKRMVKAGCPGSIINIASILGIRQGTRQLNYGVSKSGMIQMTKVMALELTRNSIRINALAPGT
jgi:NAD(P)-dependent dehydrogenase (short-subunit alcohol dehydrogenase family)